MSFEQDIIDMVINYIVVPLLTTVVDILSLIFFSIFDSVIDIISNTGTPLTFGLLLLLTIALYMLANKYVYN